MKTITTIEVTKNKIIELLKKEFNAIDANINIMYTSTPSEDFREGNIRNFEGIKMTIKNGE